MMHHNDNDEQMSRQTLKASRNGASVLDLLLSGEANIVITGVVG